ncbi:DNA replication and repair protein RecF [Actinoplanes sp. SE50]|uniref:AAA family ATPase n=1 Tax=unclassified Actinoplanes TaxID=2626549 RepID=UPI00023ECC26|nr:MULTISPECIES: AAA family ATPase [unclassified Actinoplanes]AEV82082.1 DNA replication and repair protein recF [Actinoplanes sp. SE50/110]ATO80481.1 DNA replication and repair protein RecF [Actinoplanes sp. SE50]SLL97888.1 DNA recombination protein RecF [Actinoplanes sp. SE50/110]
MYLHRLRISDVRGFHGSHEVDLGFELSADGEPTDRYPGLVVIAGRNGSGKTTLLRAAATALAGPEVTNSLTEGVRDWVTHEAATAVVHADIRLAGDEIFPPERFLEARLRWPRTEGARARPESGLDSRSEQHARISLWRSNPESWFAAGYGPFRRLAGSSSEVARLTAGDWTVARFATLFREEASLAETVHWLQQVNYRARSGQQRYADMEGFLLALLNDGLFPDGHAVDRVDPDGLWIARQSGPPMLIEEMSDGYRSVTALITDIVRQISDCFRLGVPWTGEYPPRVLTSGIVLIDEVDAHLHVSWQKRIAPWLREHFPNIQFIVTTHSPYICQSASPGGLIQLPGPDDDFAPRVVDDELYRRVVNGSADDAVLTELFGLESPYSQRVDELRAELTRLERLAIRGHAQAGDLEKLAELSEELSPSPSSRARDVLGGEA